MCTNAQLERIKSEIVGGAKRIFGDKLRKVILYGSYARGDYNEDSDIDIMILTDVNDEDVYPYRKQIREIKHELSFENDIIVSTYLQNKQFFDMHTKVLPFYRNVVNDGVELYVN